MVLESVTSTSLLSNKQQWLWVDPGEAISKLPLGFCTLLGNKLCGPGFVPVALGISQLPAQFAARDQDSPNALSQHVWGVYLIPSTGKKAFSQAGVEMAA